MKLHALITGLLFSAVSANAATISCFYQDKVTQTAHESSDYIQQFTITGEWDYSSATVTLHLKEFGLKQAANGKWSVDTSQVQNDQDEITNLAIKIVNNNGKNAAFAPPTQYADGFYYNPSLTIASGATVAGATGRFSAYFSAYQETDDVPYHQQDGMICTIK